MAVCRWSGQAWEGQPSTNGRRCWRTTRLSPADFACCRSGLKIWRSAASDQMITVNLPATTRNYMLLTPLTPLYLSFSGTAARRMPSARCTLTPCSFCTWESKEVGSPAILAARKTEYVISRPGWEAPPTPLSHRCGTPELVHPYSSPWGIHEWCTVFSTFTTILQDSFSPTSHHTPFCAVAAFSRSAAAAQSQSPSQLGYPQMCITVCIVLSCLVTAALKNFVARHK